MANASGAQQVLLAAAVAGDWNRVLAMAEAGGDLQAADEEGASLLHLALHQQRFEVAQVLLARGADARAGDRFGRTPLHYLAETADQAQAMAAAQLASALCAPRPEGGADPNAADGRGRTPLHAAAVRGLPVVIAALLAAGAEVDRAKRDGQTPLHLAVTRRRLAAVELLVKHGADPDRRAADGHSPRELAGRFNHDEILAALGAGR